MSELRMEPWRQRPYGYFARGVAEHKGYEVPIRVRSPHEDLGDESLTKILNLNGLTAGHESMAVAARTAAKLGYAAITLDYTNRWCRRPLDKNARDGLNVLEALPPGPVSILGLSMGGAVGTKVTNKANRAIDVLHLVSPGGYTSDLDRFTILEICKAFLGEVQDDSTEGLLRHPLRELAIGVDCLRNTLRRPIGVASELHELVTSTVYKDLYGVRATRPETRVVLAHASDDALVPREPLMESVHKEEGSTPGLLFDVEAPYDGVHTRLIRDPKLTEYIIEMGKADVLTAA